MSATWLTTFVWYILVHFAMKQSIILPFHCLVLYFMIDLQLFAKHSYGVALLRLIPAMNSQGNNFIMEFDLSKSIHSPLFYHLPQRLLILWCNAMTKYTIFSQKTLLSKLGGLSLTSPEHLKEWGRALFLLHARLRRV